MTDATVRSLLLVLIPLGLVMGCGGGDAAPAPGPTLPTTGGSGASEAPVVHDPQPRWTNDDARAATAALRDVRVLPRDGVLR